MCRFSFRKLLALFLLTCCGMASAASSCSVSYSTRNDWPTGFVVDVFVHNNGAAPVKDWKVNWTYGSPVQFTNPPWGANVRITGDSITSTDNGSNPTIAAGGKTYFGMALSFSGSTKPTPIGLSVSGQGCTASEPETEPQMVFYADPDSNAANWVRNNKWDGRAAAIQEHVANRPTGKWFGGWSGDIGRAVGKYVGAADSLHQMPILVAYNIPGRDCGQLSAGGLNSAEAYRTWISAFAGAVGKRKAVVILEPDALPQLDCLSAEGRAARLQLFQYAVSQFKEKAPNAWLYLDAGNSTWLPASVMASRLIAAGVANTRGFSLNVSNYHTTEASTSYGNAVNDELWRQKGLTKPFVVDTSRNGNGPYGSVWCDPPGRKLGVPSSQNAAGIQPEMTLWIKVPGDADGCAAAAGSFLPDAAYKLIYGYY